MSSGRVFAALSTLLLVVLGAPAQAHTRSESHSSWLIDKRQVRTTITFSDKEAENLAHGQRPSDEEIVTYLTPHIGVEAGGQACRPTAPGHKNLVLRFDAFFELVPSHVDIAQIQLADGNVVEQLFMQSNTRFDLTESQGGKFKGAGFIDFVKMGIMHIFTGVDHMSFLLGLVLISRRLRDLVFVVSGFTLGHSITLALAVTGIVRPHAQYIDALVALTIALVGVENVVVSLEKPAKIALSTGGFLLVLALLSFLGIGLLPPALLLGTAIFSAAYLLISGQLHESGRLRMVVTTIFGLIHGFGFAADLLEARLPPEKLAQILFGFNVGVEIGQLAVVLAVSGLVMLARRMTLATPRPITVDLLGSALIAEGVAWFLSRSFAWQ